MVAKRHKNINVPLLKKLWDIIFFWDNNFRSHFSGHFEGAQKVIVPQKKNYVPQFLKQRDINSYFLILRTFNLKKLPFHSYQRDCTFSVG
jgi:hypothetical protein